MPFRLGRDDDGNARSKLPLLCYRPSMRWTTPLLLACCLSLLGCDEPDGVCAGEDRAVPFELDTALDGENGSFTFRFLEADPAPPDLGSNDWLVSVADASGTPLEDCSLRAEPWMPDHGHGSNEPEGVEGSEAGQYALDGLDFIMPGYWTVALTAECADDIDSVVLHLCIEG